MQAILSIENIFKNLQKTKTAAGLKDQADYIDVVLKQGDKKGF